MSFLLEAAGHVAGALPMLATQLVLILALLAAAWVTGRGWVGRAVAGAEALTPAASAAIWSATGLAVLGTVAFALGLVGLLGPWSLGAVVFLGAVSAGWDGYRTLNRWTTPGDPAGWSRGETGAMAAATCVALAPALLLTLYPPNLTDDLLYHLPMTRSLAETGRLSFLDGLRYPVFPQLQEALWSPLVKTLGVRGVEALVAVHGVVAALAVYAAAQTLAVRPATRPDAPGGARATGILAVALFVGCPAAVLYGTASFVDVPLTAFVAVAGLCSGLGLRQRHRDDGNRSRGPWPLLAGLAAGAGAATKYHGAVLAGLLALPWLLDLLRRRRWRPLVVYILAAVAVAGPWYGRNLALTGNPVFPFFQESFGVFAWNGVPYADPKQILSSRSEDDYGIAQRSGAPAETTSETGGRSPVGMLAERAAAAFRRDLPKVPRMTRELFLTGRRSHGPPPLNGWLLVALAAFPVALLIRRRAAPEQRLPVWPWAVAGLYLGFWFITFRDPRYLLPVVALVLPGLVTPLAAAVHRRRPWRPLGVALAAFLVASPGLLYGAYRVATLGPVPQSQAEIGRFLDHNVAGHDLLPEVAAHRRPGDTVYVLGRSRLRSFLPGRVLGDHLGFYPFATLTADWRDPDAVAEILRRWDVDLLVTFPPLRPLDLTDTDALVQLHRDPRGIVYRVRR